MDSPGEREIHGWISLALQAQQGETETDEGPVDLRPVERADHGRSALAFRAEQDCAAMKGEAQKAGARRKTCAGVGSSDRVDSWWEMQANHHHPNARSSLAHAGPLSGFSQDDLAGQKHSRALPLT